MQWDPSMKEAAPDGAANLLGIDLPHPVSVVMSEEGVKTFPWTRRRAGVARNCAGKPNMVRVKLDGQRQYQTVARCFWRLAQ